MATKVNSAHHSVKHDLISRDNSRMVIAVAIAVFLVVFCGFAMKTLFSQSLYHNRVISEKEKAKSQLEQNVTALEELKQSYEAFVNESENILTGNPTGTGPIDGNNAKIVLDALPWKYDFPALSTSFEKILVDGGYDVETIGGSEQNGVLDGAVADVTPQDVPFTFTFKAGLADTRDLLRTLESSIRPMHIDRLGVQINSATEITTSVTLHTYYTQQKTFELGSKEVE